LTAIFPLLSVDKTEDVLVMCVLVWSMREYILLTSHIVSQVVFP
jgi:hypothetical protein